MLDPVHWNSQKNEFSPGAFTDVETIGMSSNRIEHTKIEFLVQAAESRAKEYNKAHHDKLRQFLGFVVFRVSDIRQGHFQADENAPKIRLFGAFDTAMLNNESHSDVLRLGHNTEDKRHKLRAKAVLWELGNQWLISRHGNHVTATQFSGLIEE